jgi:hypothetical protein
MACDGLKPLRGNGPYGVRRDSYTDALVSAVPRTQRIHVPKDVIDVRVPKSPLCPLERATGTRSRIGDAKDGHTEPFFESGLHHDLRQKGAIVVRSAVRLMMDVVKLPHGRDAGATKLSKGDTGDGVHALGVEGMGQPVHRVAPAPKIARCDG